MCEAVKRGHAVDACKLESMWAENQLVPRAAGAAVAIGDYMVEAAATSRKNVLDALTDEEATVGMIMKTMAEKRKFQLTRDKYWRVEIAL